MVCRFAEPGMNLGSQAPRGERDPEETQRGGGPPGCFLFVFPIETPRELRIPMDLEVDIPHWASQVRAVATQLEEQLEVKHIYICIYIYMYVYIYIYILCIYIILYYIILYYIILYYIILYYIILYYIILYYIILYYIILYYIILYYMYYIYIYYVYYIYIYVHV